MAALFGMVTGINSRLLLLLELLLFLATLDGVCWSPKSRGMQWMPRIHASRGIAVLSSLIVPLDIYTELYVEMCFYEI